MKHLDQLLHDVASAWKRYTSAVETLTDEQAHWKPSTDDWSVAENTEHLYWAGHGGIWGMWRALLAKQNGKPVWEGELTHRGLPI